MNQRERMNNAGNAWEADPWDAPDAIADRQLTGFTDRAALPLEWKKPVDIGRVDEKRFGMEDEWFSGLDVEFYAVHEDEDYVLMQLIWHGFPDPPEWRLASRRSGKYDQQWEEWGYFTNLPIAWKFPKEPNARNN